MPPSEASSSSAIPAAPELAICTLIGARRKTLGAGRGCGLAWYPPLWLETVCGLHADPITLDAHTAAHAADLAKFNTARFQPRAQAVPSRRFPIRLDPRSGADSCALHINARADAKQFDR
jgi:hypothetical protein